ncbi:MAG TPA: hypothetical protein VGH33_01790 [Isosphaeraceae bacterium]
MGHWGVRSYENDDAGDALDAGFARAHGPTYEDLMDDANPLSPEQVQQRLAGPETLTGSLDALAEDVGRPIEEWDEVARLAFAWIVVRHAELGMPIPPDVRDRALAFLRDEPIDWEEATARRLRRDKEIRLLESIA